MKVSFLCLCLLVLVGSCHAGGGAVRGSHTSHHGMMVRTVRKPIASGHLRAEIDGWLGAWKAKGFSLPTTGESSPAFVEDIVRDMIANKVSCADGSPFVYTSIFGGNMCFDYLVVRALREYAGFTCDIEIQNIEVVGPTAEEEAYIKHHADVQRIRQYKGVYDFIEEEKKRSPSDVVVSTQPAYYSTVSLTSNPTESQVLKYIIDEDDTFDLKDEKLRPIADFWHRPLNPGMSSEFSLLDLLQSPSNGVLSNTPLRFLENVRHGLLSLLEMSAEQFAAYTASGKAGWIPALGRRFTDRVHTRSVNAMQAALSQVHNMLAYLTQHSDFVVPCFIDECLVFTHRAHEADEFARKINKLKYVIDTYRGAKGQLSYKINSVIHAMAVGTESVLPSLYRSRSGDLHIALYDVLASTSMKNTRAYILRGQSGPKELSAVEKPIWNGLRMESAAVMQVLLKNTFMAEYAALGFHVPSARPLSEEEAKQCKPFVRSSVEL